MSKLAEALEREIARAVREEVKDRLAPLEARVRELERALARGSSPRRRSRARTARASSEAPRIAPKTIKSLRQKHSLSQRELALLTGVTSVAVYFWESGRTRPSGPNADALLELRGQSKAEISRRLDELEGE